MKMKMKRSLLLVASSIFAICLSVICGFGFAKPTYTVSADGSSIEMISGASVRLVSNDPGLRFTATVSKTEYEAVKTANGTFGMFILPNAYRTSVGEIDETNAFGESATYCWGSATEGKTQIVHCEVDELMQMSEDGNSYYFVCALTNIKATNYELDFFARAYYEVDGVRTWAAINENNVRSASYVAQKALGDADYTPTAAGKTALVEYVTQFEEVNADAEGQASLYVADLANVASIAVDGAAATYTNTDGKATLSNLTTGRHTATVTHNDGSTWDVPFVYATMVLRTSDDIEAMEALWTETYTATSSYLVENQYFVLANDITYTNTSGYQLPDQTNCKLQDSTFDGYGHSIKNLLFKGARWGLLGNTITRCTVKDVAFVDAYVSGSTNATVICGSMSASTIENVFISGYCNSSNGNSYLMAGRCSTNSKITDCVVIDNSYAKKEVTLNAKNTAAVTRMTASDTTASISNTVVCTGGTAVANNATAGVDLMTNGDTRVTDCAKVGLNDAASLITALKALAAKDNDWTFDEETNTLYLMGNAVYTVVTE